MANTFRLYPIYFHTTATKKSRKVPISKSLKNITIETLKKILSKHNIQYKEEDKRHPRSFTAGSLEIAKDNMCKKEIYKIIGNEITEIIEKKGTANDLIGNNNIKETEKLENKTKKVYVRRKKNKEEKNKKYYYEG